MQRRAFPPSQRSRPARRRFRVGTFGDLVAALAAFSVIAGLNFPKIASFWTVSTEAPQARARTEQSVYYPNCAAARAAGAAPIYAGSPGYRDSLDGDGDGIACEPFRGGGRAW